jgi:ankyrin repeat protein
VSAAGKLQALAERGTHAPALVLLRAVIKDSHGSSDAVDALIAAGADVNVVSKSGSTALHAAACRGKCAVVRALLGAGAHIDAVGGARGYTALMRAILYGCVDVVRVLLGSGADVSVRSNVSNRGYTALHFAARMGNSDVVPLLLEAGADVAAETDNGQTALHCAAEFGSPTLISTHCSTWQ